MVIFSKNRVELIIILLFLLLLLAIWIWYGIKLQEIEHKKELLSFYEPGVTIFKNH